MEPAFHRGDLLFLTNWVHEPYYTGEILVYKIPGAPVPIVHRVLETHDILPLKRNEIEPGCVSNWPSALCLTLTAYQISRIRTCQRPADIDERGQQPKG